MFNWLLNLHKCFGHKRQRSEEPSQAPAPTHHVAMPDVQSRAVELGPHGKEPEYGIQLFDETRSGAGAQNAGGNSLRNCGMVAFSNVSLLNSYAIIKGGDLPTLADRAYISIK